MIKNALKAMLGIAVLAVSCAASAHVDVGIDVGIPGPVFVPAQPEYAPPPPVVYAQPPVVAYGGDEDWREREWQERREWRERQWRHREEREREWHERHGWDGD